MGEKITLGNINVPTIAAMIIAFAVGGYVVNINIENVQIELSEKIDSQIKETQKQLRAEQKAFAEGELEQFKQQLTSKYGLALQEMNEAHTKEF